MTKSEAHEQKCPEPDCVLIAGHPGMHEGQDYARIAGIAPSSWLWRNPDANLREA